MAVLPQDPWSPTPSRTRGGPPTALRSVAAVVLGAAAPASLVWTHGATGRRAALGLIAVAIGLVVVLDRRRGRWSSVGLVAVVVGVGAAVTVPLVGRAPVLVVALGSIVASWCLVGALRPRGRPASEGRVASLALPFLVVAEVGWFRSASPLRFALLVGAAAAVTGAYDVWPGPLGRATEVLDRGTKAVVKAVASALLFVVALPFVYLPGAIARLATRWRRSSEGSWQPSEPVRAQVRDAARPFASPPARVAAWRHVASLAVVVALAVVVLAERPTTDRDGGTPYVEVHPPQASLADRLDAVPYSRRAAFAGVDFADDLQAETMEVKLVPDPETGYRPSDSTGSLLNVEDGIRTTVRSTCTSCPAVRLWLVGGSLVFGVGQRDEHTIASDLVRRAADQGIDLEVSNLGVPGWTLAQEQAAVAERLRSGAPKPDVVVFLDGYNDTLATLMDLLANGGEAPTGPAILDLEKSERLLSKAGDGGLGAFPGRRYGRLAAERYRRTAAPFDRVMASAGIDVLRFFQPDASSSPVQRHGVESLEVLPEGFYDTSQMDAVLGSSARSLARSDQVHDLRGALDQLDRPVFLDTSHVNERGAQLLAEALGRSLDPVVRGHAS